MISANGGLPAHRYTPQVTQRLPRGSEPASAALFHCLLGSAGVTEACAVLDCNNWPRCPSCIALLLPLRGKEDQFFPLFGPGGPLRGFPRGTHGQTWFAIRTVHNDPSNRRVGGPSEPLSQLFARVLNRQSSLLGLIQALQKGKNCETVVQAVQACG